MTTIEWLTPFKEITAVYSENRIKPANEVFGQSAGLLNVKTGRTCRYFWVLNGNNIPQAQRLEKL
jgi:hypothetical protein